MWDFEESAPELNSKHQVQNPAQAGSTNKVSFELKLYLNFSLPIRCQARHNAFMGKFHKDMRIRSRKKLKVDGVITFGAPCCGHFEGILPAGEVLKLNYEPHDRVRSLWLEPERYSDLEQVFVPKQSRIAPAYGGYAVGCDYDQIGVDFEILDQNKAA